MSAKKETPGHRVVVIGSGFGGLTAAQRLGKSEVSVTLIAKTTHHLFQPMLYQVATGILPEGAIAPATRVILGKFDNIRVELGEVERIDLERQVVTSRLLGRVTETPYDSLIVAAGASQSYFGNDRLADFAPGLKTIDDALEIRARIVGAYEQAELSQDENERAKLLTFVIVGGGPTGVELAGQIAEMAHRTLRGSFRTIDPGDARVILIDSSSQILRPYGARLGRKAAQELERGGVEIQYNARVVDMDFDGLVIKDEDGTLRRIESQCKVWSAGVAASPLGAQLAAQSGVELERSGCVKVRPDLSIPGFPNVFVVGDMASVDKVPGVAQGAIQGGRYAASAVLAGLAGEAPEQRKPFSYWDKGSMAIVSRYTAVALIPIPGIKKAIGLTGIPAWLGWLGVHLMFLVGFRNRLMTALDWFFAFTTLGRTQLTVTEQQVYGREALNRFRSFAESGED